MALVNESSVMALYGNSVKALMQSGYSVLALIVNTYENGVMALVNESNVMALYDNSVKTLRQMW